MDVGVGVGVVGGVGVGVGHSPVSLSILCAWSQLDVVVIVVALAAGVEEELVQGLVLLGAGLMVMVSCLSLLLVGDDLVVPGFFSFLTLLWTLVPGVGGMTVVVLDPLYSSVRRFIY